MRISFSDLHIDKINPGNAQDMALSHWLSFAQIESLFNPLTGGWRLSSMVIHKEAHGGPLNSHCTIGYLPVAYWTESSGCCVLETRTGGTDLSMATAALYIKTDLTATEASPLAKTAPTCSSVVGATIDPRHCCCGGFRCWGSGNWQTCYTATVMTSCISLPSRACVSVIPGVILLSTHESKHIITNGNCSKETSMLLKIHLMGIRILPIRQWKICAVKSGLIDGKNSCTNC